MIPPRRDSLDDARRRLDEAAGALDDMRRLTGAAAAPGAGVVSASEGASESVRREALTAARDDLRRMASDLEAARARGSTLVEEVGRLREELAARPTAHDLKAAHVAGESNAARRAAELDKQVAGLQARVALLSAEHVRLETLRRKAEAFGEGSEASRRSLEETLRRDLLAAHAALDRAAAESGTREAKAVSELEEMHKRLDHALSRLDRQDRENLALKQESEEKASFRGDFEAAQAVIVSLRRELSEQRADASGRESALESRAHELERRLTGALSPQGAGLLQEIGRLREELAARPTELDLENARGAEETLKRDLNAALAARAALERATAESSIREAKAAAEIAETRKRLDQALVRLHLEDMALKQASAEGLSLRGDVSASEEAVASLRRELSEQRAASLVRERELARAAAESAERAAKAAASLEEMRKRLDREGLARTQAGAEESSIRGDLLAAQGVIASLRRELSEQRAEALGRERELTRAVAEYGTREAKAVAEIEEMRKRLDHEGMARKLASAAESALRNDFETAQGIIVSLREELGKERASALSRERALEQRVHELERRPPEALAPPSAPAGDEPEVGAEEAGVEYPSMEYSLEPGWGRLLRIVKPPLQAAYGHLRRLSAGPMSAGQRAILRLTGSSLSQASDSLATIELALADTPATTEMAPVLPVLESALAAWEAVFRRRGINLTREFVRTLSDSPHDPEQLRLALHHILRNALEALPRGATLRVHLKSAADSARLEFRDDGPGYPPAWLERQFEPFVSPRQGHAGLGLAAVRRALRRWGGDAAASNSADGRGACLILTFAAAPVRPAMKS